MTVPLRISWTGRFDQRKRKCESVLSDSSAPAPNCSELSPRFCTRFSFLLAINEPPPRQRTVRRILEEYGVCSLLSHWSIHRLWKSCKPSRQLMCVSRNQGSRNGGYASVSRELFMSPELADLLLLQSCSASRLALLVLEFSSSVRTVDSAFPIPRKPVERTGHTILPSNFHRHKLHCR